MAAFQDGAIFIGDTVQLQDTITQPDGVTPYNLTNATVTFRAKLFDNVNVNVFNKVQAIGSGVSSGDVQSPTPTNGQLFAWIRPADTSGLIPWSLLYLYFIVTDSNGNVYTTKKCTARMSV